MTHALDNGNLRHVHADFHQNRVQVLNLPHTLNCLSLFPDLSNFRNGLRPLRLLRFFPFRVSGVLRTIAPGPYLIFRIIANKKYLSSQFRKIFFPALFLAFVDISAGLQYTHGKPFKNKRVRHAGLHCDRSLNICMLAH